MAIYKKKSWRRGRKKKVPDPMLKSSPLTRNVRNLPTYLLVPYKQKLSPITIGIYLSTIHPNWDYLYSTFVHVLFMGHSPPFAHSLERSREGSRHQPHFSGVHTPLRTYWRGLRKKNRTKKFPTQKLGPKSTYLPTSIGSGTFFLDPPWRNCLFLIWGKGKGDLGPSKTAIFKKYPKATRPKPLF